MAGPARPRRYPRIAARMRSRTAGRGQPARIIVVTQDGRQRRSMSSQIRSTGPISATSATNSVGIGAAQRLHAARTRIDRPLAEVRAQLPEGADVAGLRVIDDGTHLEVRATRAAGRRLDATELDLWILLPADASTADREAAEANWAALSG